MEELLRDHHSVALEHQAVLHDEIDPSKRIDVLQGIPRNSNDVGGETRLQGTPLVLNLRALVAVGGSRRNRDSAGSGSPGPDRSPSRACRSPKNSRRRDPRSPHAISSDVAALAAGAAIDVFARDAVTQRIWIAGGDIDSAAFSETVLDGPAILPSAPTVALDQNGELRLVVAVADDNNLHWNRRRPGETWARWNALPRQTVRSRPALLALGDGRMGIYATATQGRELLRVSELASWLAAQ